MSSKKLNQYLLFLAIWVISVISFSACKNKPEIIRPGIFKYPNAINCKVLDNLPSYINANRVGEVFEYSQALQTPTIGEINYQYKIGGSKIIHVETATASPTDFKITILKSGTTSLVVELNSAKVKIRRDADGDEILDEIFYEPVTCLKTMTIDVVVPKALDIVRENLLTLTTTGIPIAISDEKGKLLSYPLATAISDIGSPSIHYSSSMPNVATIQQNNGKISIQLLGQGTASLTIRAEIGKQSRKEDINGDGVLDNITYSANSTEKYLNVSVISTPLTLTLTNLITLTRRSIPNNIIGTIGKSVEYAEATVVASKGTPVLSYNVSDNSVASVSNSSGKIQVQFLKSGVTSLTIQASIANDTTVQEDANRDGVIDSVTYKANSVKEYSKIEVFPPALSVTRSNLITIMRTSIPINITGLVGASVEYNEATAVASKGNPSLSYSLADKSIARVSNNNRKVQIQFLKSGTTSLTIQASIVNDMTMQEDTNGDNVKDMVIYRANSVKEYSGITVSPAPLTITKTNLITITRTDIPLNVSGTVGNSIEYNEATAIASKGTPVLSYNVSDNSIASVSNSSGKIQVRFLKSGTTSLTIQASIANDTTVQEDVNNDGIIDSVTYQAHSVKEYSGVRVSPAPLTIAKTNLITITRTAIPLSITGVAGKSVEYNEATAVASKGTPVLSYNVSDNSMARVSNSSGKIQVQFLNSGTTSLTIQASIANDTTVQEDVNSDGIIDSVTYKANSVKEYSGIAVSPAPLIITRTNLITLTYVPLQKSTVLSVTGSLYFDPEADFGLGVKASMGTPTITYGSSDQNVATVNTTMNQGKEMLRIDYLNPGTSSLTIRAEIANDMVVQEDVNQDGVLDQVTYKANSTEIRYVNINYALPLVVTLDNTITPDFSDNFASNPLHFDRIRGVLDRGFPIIHSYGGTPTIEFERADKAIKIYIDDDEKRCILQGLPRAPCVFIYLISSDLQGSSSFVIKVTIPENIVQKDINNDGVTDTVTYREVRAEYTFQVEWN